VKASSDFSDFLAGPNRLYLTPPPSKKGLEKNLNIRLTFRAVSLELHQIVGSSNGVNYETDAKVV
jgi:hypothetical protein